MRVSALTKTSLLLATTLIYGTGCTTLDPYTGESKTSNTTAGALIGAGAGAVLGAVTGKDAKDRRQRALVGAGIGGLTGAAVGNYMDRQEAELRQQLRGTGVSVTRDGDNIILNMPGNITFRTGSADLQPQFFKVLDSVGLVVKKYDQTLVEVVGHTDSVGGAQLNQRLSEDRAATVAQYLIGRGLLQERTLTMGAGPSRPIASNANEAGRSRNRRVEISLVPVKKS